MSLYSSEDSNNTSYSDVSEESILSQESLIEDEYIEVITGVEACTPWTTPPPPWYERYTPRPASLPITRQTVRRDNRLTVGATLPVFSAPNCRSLAPKLKSFKTDMIERGITIALCSEIWEPKSNKKHLKEIERMFEIDGLKMISYPRKYRRGGGVAIVADISAVSMKLLDVPNPDNLEVLFTLVKPKSVSEISEIIPFSFYCPPRSRKKTKLTDYIVTTLHSLLTVWPKAGIMGGGDRNDWNISPVLSAIPRLQNLQMLPTLNGKKT